ncbi:BON domain-containing protein [Paraburkholderia fynbosensis]|uniref:BON domain-containing protein n=1 Tax=Paraburkholderia fynbosensis TaxID=1200993 RepID=UPI003CCE4498
MKYQLGGLDQHCLKASDGNIVLSGVVQEASQIPFAIQAAGNVEGMRSVRESLVSYAAHTVIYRTVQFTLVRMSCEPAALPDALCLSTRDTLAPVVPMLHVNAWGMPFSAPLVGARLVFPGAKLDGESLSTLFAEEGVTMSAGVPTVARLREAS